MIPIRVVRDEYDRIADKVMEVMTAKPIGCPLKNGYYWVWQYCNSTRWTVEAWTGQGWWRMGETGSHFYTPYRIAHLIEPPPDPRNWNDA